MSDSGQPTSLKVCGRASTVLPVVVAVITEQPKVLHPQTLL